MPALELLFHEHIHHIILHCAVVVAVLVSALIILVGSHEAKSHISSLLEGFFGVALDTQVGADGTGLEISFDAQLSVDGLF